jgi:beta-glucosidase
MPLPPGFLLGCATSSHQIEGNNRNDWTRWEDAGRAHERSGRAADSWDRWRDDLVCLEELGANAYRFSIEWSRLEPEEGRWDDAAADRYRAMISALRERGIASMVTLFHFTLPLWVADRGGVEWDGGAEAFFRFASRAARALGEPDLWCTINEPNVYAYFGYLKGTFPPGISSLPRTVGAMRQLNRWHRAARRGLRDAGSKAPIGIAHHMRPMDPLRPTSIADRLAAGAGERLFHGIPERVLLDGDYIGLNYYSRDFVSSAGVVTSPVADRSDLGWEIYPEGLHRCLQRLARFGKPIYVTENGVADASGARRPAFLRSHLDAVDRARAEGIDVRGYFHWSLIDNFEWAEGYGPRFGLYSVTPDTFERRPSSGVDVFREATRRYRLQTSTR